MSKSRLVTIDAANDCAETFAERMIAGLGLISQLQPGVVRAGQRAGSGFLVKLLHDLLGSDLGERRVTPEQVRNFLQKQVRAQWLRNFHECLERKALSQSKPRRKCVSYALPRDVER